MLHTDVGGDEVADELLHVVVDSTALLYGGHDGGEVVVSEHHLGGRLGDGGSGAHSNTDLSLLQSGSVVHTVTGLGGQGGKGGKGNGQYHFLELL